MTDKKRPGTPNPAIHSQEERDLAAIKRRREELEDGEEDTPVEQFDESTKPTDLVAMRIENDPAFRLLWERVSRIKSEERYALRTLGNQTMELHQNVDPELARRVDEMQHELTKIKTAQGIAKWVLGFVLAAALGSVIVVATKIFTWGYSSGELEIRINHVEKQIEQCSARIDRLLRRSDSAADKPDNAQPKGNP